MERIPTIFVCLLLVAAQLACNQPEHSPVDAARIFLDTASAFAEERHQGLQRALVALLCEDDQKHLKAAIKRIHTGLPEVATGNTPLTAADAIMDLHVPDRMGGVESELTQLEENRARVLMQLTDKEGQTRAVALDLVREQNRWQVCLGLGS